MFYKKIQESEWLLFSLLGVEVVISRVSCHWTCIPPGEVCFLCVHTIGIWVRSSSFEAQLAPSANKLSTMSYILWVLLWSAYCSCLFLDSTINANANANANASIQHHVQALWPNVSPFQRFPQGLNCNKIIIDKFFTMNCDEISLLSSQMKTNMLKN